MPSQVLHDFKCIEIYRILAPTSLTLQDLGFLLPGFRIQEIIRAYQLRFLCALYR
ncbi:hypothetical protein MC7420_6014 [Coleofasciculus chthonoplastes PCC 7420]|uniref:Uncharacterized protein n=1 Tax=Coleofasciculus chthonoplastes PCC 7420 TaxID=118168 RepID=B4VTI4_9CYAN|nr:hypothetical protein MC7420_6014 [Coleofasciculus chthonoplastes PCC 7420]